MYFIPSFRLVFVMFCMFVFASCASKVRTSITTFKNDAAPFSVGSIYISPVDGHKTKSGLEFQFYKGKLATRLENVGYTVVDDTSADFIAFLDYGTVRREKEVSNSSVQLGLGYGHFSRFGRLVFTEPLTREFEFVRRVQLGIEKNVAAAEKEKAGSAHKLVELDAVSLGRCAQLTQVYEPMLDAIFKNLFRANGSTVKVAVPGAATCK